MNELDFLDRIDKINRMGRQPKVGLGQAAVLWCFGHALQIIRKLCVLCGYFVPGFHQFLFPIRCFACRLVHFVVHPWIPAV